MSKVLGPSVLDAALAEINTATAISFCSTYPTSALVANIGTIVCEETGITPGTLLGTLANGAVSADGNVSGYYNRKMTVAARTGMSVSNAGAVVCAVIHDGTDILHVAQNAAASPGAGETWDSDSFDIELECDMT